MRRFFYLVFLCSLGLGSPLTKAQSNDPSEMFLNAYMSVQQGEKLERDGQLKPALAKYRYAASLLEQVHEKFPTWQPLIVEYRKKRTSENIGKLQEKIASKGPGSSEPPSTPGSLGELPSELEAPLPQRDEPGGPSSIMVTPSGGGTVPSEVADQATREIKNRIAQLQKELNDSREQIKSVQQEKEEIASRLDTAIRELDKVKVSDSENRTKLRQLQEELKNRPVDTTAGDAGRKVMQEEIARLQNALQDARAERDAADQVNTDNARRLGKARKTVDAVAKERDAATMKTKDLEAKFADAAKLAADLEAAQKKVAALTKDRDAEHQAASEFQGKLADAQKQLAEIGRERDAARKQSAELDGRLAEAKKQIEAVGKERDSMAKQRDIALADLAKARAASKQVDKLMADNASLMQKLSTAEKTIQQFNIEMPKKDAEIAILKKEIGDVKDQLATAQKESRDFQSSIGELQTQFDTASSELAYLKSTATGSEERKKLTEENDLLRGIVLRELKEQSRRDQAKKLVVTELKKLEVQSNVLMEQIDYLGQPVVKLSEKERALFKQPQIEILDTDSSSMAISIAAAKPEASAETPAAGTPKTTASETRKPAEEAKAEKPGTPAPAVSSKPSDSGEDLPVKDSMTLAKNEPPAKEQAKPDGAPSVETAPAPNIPEDLLPLAREGKEQFDRGNYREAEKAYEKILSQAPNNIYALSNLGVVRFRAGKLKLAEEAFKKAIAVSPQDSFSQCTLGIVYYQQGKYDEAINSLTKAISVNPKYSVAHNYLGITASQKGWQEAATKELETALALDPNYADANFNMAVIYATRQPPDKEKALKYYKRATELGAEPDAALEQLIK